MAYNQEQILQECIEAIEREGLCFFDEIACFVKPDLSSLYNWDFHELDVIKNGLRKNKVAAKRKMKRNWQREDAAPALQIAVYKLMADDDEFNKLTTSKSDIKADVTTLPLITIPDAPAE